MPEKHAKHSPEHTVPRFVHFPRPQNGHIPMNSRLKQVVLAVVILRLLLVSRDDDGGLAVGVWFRELNGDLAGFDECTCGS